MIGGVDLKHIPLDPELAFWMEKAKTAIEARAFQPTVVGYWTPGMAILAEQGSRHFCLAFPPPATQEDLEGLALHLKLQLLYNNAAAYLYVGGQKIKGGESDTALVVLGDNGEDRICWVTPFKIDGKETHYYDTVLTDPEAFGPWDGLLPTEEMVKPEMDLLVRNLHAYLMQRDHLPDDCKAVDAFFKERGEPSTFPGVPSPEVFQLCVLYLASRTPLDEVLSEVSACTHT